MSTPHFGIQDLGENDPIGYVRVNAAMRVLEAMTRGKVADRDLTAPPGSPTEGAMYLIAATATGAWAGHDAELAIYVQGDWHFVVPAAGDRIWVVDEAVHLIRNNSTWATV